MKIRVHVCENPGAKKCRCRELISRDAAVARIAAGTARTLRFKKTSGEIVVNDRAIAVVVTQRFPKRPATSIEEDHIEAAYVKGIKSAQDFVENFGQLNQEILASIGAAMEHGEVIAQDVELIERKGISPTVEIMPPQPGEGPLFR